MFNLVAELGFGVGFTWVRYSHRGYVELVFLCIGVVHSCQKKKKKRKKNTQCSKWMGIYLFSCFCAKPLYIVLIEAWACKTRNLIEREANVVLHRLEWTTTHKCTVQDEWCVDTYLLYSCPLSYVSTIHMHIPTK